MKKILLTIIVLLSCTFAIAQHDVGTWSLVPRVGVNLANVSNMQVSVLNTGAQSGESISLIKSNYLEAFVGGVDAQYQAFNKVAFSAGVFYSVQGYRFPAYENILSDKSHVGTSDFQRNMTYLNFPVVAHFFVAKGLSVNVGAQVGFLLAAKDKYNESKFTFDKDGKIIYATDDQGAPIYAKAVENDVKDQLNDVDFSIPVGLSYEWNSVEIVATYNWGMSNLTKEGSEKDRNKVFMLTVGYQFDL